MNAEEFDRRLRLIEDGLHILSSEKNASSSGSSHLSAFLSWLGPAILAVGTIFVTAHFTKQQALPNALAASAASKIADRTLDITDAMHELSDLFRAACASIMDDPSKTFVATKPFVDLQRKLREEASRAPLPTDVKDKLAEFRKVVADGDLELRNEKLTPDARRSLATTFRTKSEKALQDAQLAIEHFLYCGPPTCK